MPAPAPHPAAPLYAPPPGDAAPDTLPVAPAAAPLPAARPAATGPGLGLVALVAGIAAAVIPTILISVASFQVGLGAGKALALRPITQDFDWSVLTPVRDWVLLAEVSFWLGTALGVWAIVQGIIALVKNRGRGFAIAALCVAVAGFVFFAVALQGFLTAGLAAGSSIGG
jgi:hypothetical protein